MFLATLSLATSPVFNGYLNNTFSTSSAHVERVRDLKTARKHRA